MSEPAAWRVTAAAASSGSPLPDVPPPPPASPPGSTGSTGSPVSTGSPTNTSSPANDSSPAKADEATGGSPAKADEASGGSRRRTGVDPVKALMHRHRELCERAVDALEIAAGLEAHGVTDRTAARFRHRDVFSLADEMYARVPRDSDIEPETRHAVSEAACGRRPVWAALALLPGTLGALTLVGLDHTGGRLR
ncbi:hypothetical protein ACFC18_53800, partial [Streptomyces sp. NPDC056121]